MRCFLVTDRGTASASEPLAHLLKTTGRATLVGERTAGATLLALPHPLVEGFVVVVPKADYYMADGTRLEGRGVEPDIKTTSQEALVVVADRIRSTRPYPGSLLLGAVYKGLKRRDGAGVSVGAGCGPNRRGENDRPAAARPSRCHAKSVRSERR